MTPPKSEGAPHPSVLCEVHGKWTDVCGCAPTQPAATAGKASTSTPQENPSLDEWLAAYHVTLDERQLWAVRSYIVMNHLPVAAAPAEPFDSAALGQGQIKLASELCEAQRQLKLAKVDGAAVRERAIMVPLSKVLDICNEPSTTHYSDYIDGARWVRGRVIALAALASTPAQPALLTPEQCTAAYIKSEHLSSYRQIGMVLAGELNTVLRAAPAQPLLMQVMNFLDEATPEDADTSHWAARAYQEIGAKFNTSAAPAQREAGEALRIRLRAFQEARNITAKRIGEPHVLDGVIAELETALAAEVQKC
jgi:hypothetical protein